MAKLTLIQTPDGNLDMIYLDNYKEMAHDVIYASEIFAFMKENMPITKVESKELTWEACDKYDYSFPKLLSQYHEDDFK